MKKLFLAAVLAIAALALQAQTITTPQYEEAVQVNGKAEKKITPDEVWVAIILRDNEPKGQTVDKLETNMKRQFKALGIEIDKALKVTSMANAPRKRNDVNTYRSYELKVGSAEMLASVFEVLGEMGVSTANVVRVSHSQIDRFRREVRIEAVKNAHAIATELAEAVDQKVGPAVWIVDNGFYESSPMPVYRTRAVADAIQVVAYGTDTGSQGLDMQEITLTCNVMAKFVLFLQ